MSGAIARPLVPCSHEDFRNLLCCLWSFLTCNSSHDDHVSGRCRGLDCSFLRITDLDAFYKFYKKTCFSYKAQTHCAESALNTHNDVFDLIKILRSNPDISKELLAQTCLGNHTAGSPLILNEDRDKATALAIQIMTMINIRHFDPSSGTIDFVNSQNQWFSNMSLSQFVESALPQRVQQSSFEENNINDDELLVVSNLTASRVAKRAKLKFKPTDDLSRHLKLDHEMRTVEVFHHAAFLKEHLRLTRGGSCQASISEQLKIGAIPRQVALEILDSIQKVLFRHSCAQSRAILRSLVSKENFDPECLNFEASALRLPEEENVKYEYFGSRMAELYEEIEHPAPSGLIEKWMERRSSARHVMMATLIGVAFAILLGIFSLIVSIYQAWISYQAWQHPVTSGPASTG